MTRGQYNRVGTYTRGRFKELVRSNDAYAEMLRMQRGFNIQNLRVKKDEIAILEFSLETEKAFSKRVLKASKRLKITFLATVLFLNAVIIAQTVYFLCFY